VLVRGAGIIGSMMLRLVEATGAASVGVVGIGAERVAVAG
jgi:threonine dehydrogenase-like Zn-dependent dehydrogenase